MKVERRDGNNSSSGTAGIYDDNQNAVVYNNIILDKKSHTKRKVILVPSTIQPLVPFTVISCLKSCHLLHLIPSSKLDFFRFAKFALHWCTTICTYIWHKKSKEKTENGTWRQIKSLDVLITFQPFAEDFFRKSAQFTWYQLVASVLLLLLLLLLLLFLLICIPVT